MRLFQSRRLLLFFVIGAVPVTILVVLLRRFSMNRGTVTLPDGALRKKLVTLCEEKYMPLCAPSAGFGEGCNPRVVARIQLGKARSRCADITAWLVTSGTHEKLEVARCASERRPAQFPVDRRCSVVLWDYVRDIQPALEPPQRMSRLWVPGLRAGGETVFLYEAFPVTHSRTLTESFWAGETCLFYVEGDREWIFTRFYDWNQDGTITFNVVTLHKAGAEPWRSRVDSTRLWPMRSEETVDAHKGAGFTLIELWGDMTGARYDPINSPNLIITARRA